jgi:hypothetical protein
MNQERYLHFSDLDKAQIVLTYTPSMEALLAFDKNKVIKFFEYWDLFTPRNHFKESTQPFLYRVLTYLGLSNHKREVEEYGQIRLYATLINIENSPGGADYFRNIAFANFVRIAREYGFQIRVHGNDDKGHAYKLVDDYQFYKVTIGADDSVSDISRNEETLKLNNLA